MSHASHMQVTRKSHDTCLPAAGSTLGACDPLHLRPVHHEHHITPWAHTPPQAGVALGVGWGRGQSPQPSCHPSLPPLPTLTYSWTRKWLSLSSSEGLPATSSSTRSGFSKRWHPIQLMPTHGGRGGEGRGGEGRGGEGSHSGYLPKKAGSPLSLTDGLPGADLGLNIALPALMAVDVATGCPCQELLSTFSTNWACLLYHTEGEERGEGEGRGRGGGGMVVYTLQVVLYIL